MTNSKQNSIWKATTIAVTIAVATLGCKSAKDDESHISTIMRVRDGARYSSDNGTTWKPIKKGGFLEPGDAVQTARSSDVYISLGERVRPMPRVGSPFDPVVHPSNLLRLFSDSFIVINKVERITTPEPPGCANHIRFALRAGAVQGNVKSMPAGSVYEVVLTNGIARMQECIYRLDAGGNLAVLQGSAEIEFKGRNSTNRVASGEAFDAISGQVEQMPPPRTANWTHDIWLPADPMYIPWAEPR